VILHFCSRADWAAAESAGSYAAEDLASEGFIHCSTAEQVPFSANLFARGRADLVLLEIDERELPVRYEEADGHVFPHVYGPIPVAAVVAVHEFPPGPDGTFTLPPTVGR
jgi:uncharacterized protein (DUF952 family)